MSLTEREEEQMDEAMENTERLAEFASAMVDDVVGGMAQEKGRTREEQIRRMGDGFAYQAAEQNPNQKQLDDYFIDGEWQVVER